MNYDIEIHIQSNFVNYVATKHCHTLADASRTFRYYVGRPNVAAVRLYQEKQLIWEKQKGEMSYD